LNGIDVFPEKLESIKLSSFGLDGLPGINTAPTPAFALFYELPH
jgi:hypothetical protein